MISHHLIYLILYNEFLSLLFLRITCLETRQDFSITMQNMSIFLPFVAKGL